MESIMWVVGIVICFAIVIGYIGKGIRKAYKFIRK